MGDAARGQAREAGVELIGGLDAFIKRATEEVHVRGTVREKVIPSVRTQ